MKLQDRNLSQGIIGDDVKLLQGELHQLGLVIADAEVAKNLFGETTLRAVTDFQESHGLSVDGIVGMNTANEISVAIAGLLDPKNGEPKPTKDILSNQYVIQGQIRQMDKKPAAGLIARAFNKDASGSESKLGESVSDEHGRYRITYSESLFSTLSGDRKSLDMVLRVFDPTHKMNEGWNVVRITQPVENLDPRDVSWLPWKESETAPLSVAGHVRGADGRPATSLTVRAFDRDLRNEEELGTTVTDNQGHYQINYSASQFRRHEKGSADLIVRVSDGAGTTPVASPTIFNAKQLEIVDLSFGSESRGPSEYETMLKELAPLLQGVPLSELVENAEHQDISFLSGETGFDPLRITWLVQAENLKRETQIRAEVFYGLFRQKLPTMIRNLLGPITQPLRQSLERSVFDNIIPALSAAELDEILEQLQSLRTDLILKPAGDDQQSSLGDLLNTTELSPDKKRIIAELQLQHGGTSEPFWKALNERDEFSEGEVKKVNVTFQLAALTGTHLPLVVELQALASKGPASGTNGGSASSLRPFARLDVADWKALLDQPQKNGQPVGVPFYNTGRHSRGES